MYMHPKTFLWIQEQDRERMFQQRALERAAKSGGEQRPGIVRGGLASIVKFVRQAASPRPPGRPRRVRPRSSPALRTLDLGPASSLLTGGGGTTPGPIMVGMARRLSSPIFVGRSEELHTLLATADLAADGHPALVLVGGEAGVGKSRLVEEAVGRLRDRDWLVIEGGAVALGEDGLPFGPIVEALRSLARQVDPNGSRKPPDRACESLHAWSPR